MQFQQEFAQQRDSKQDCCLQGDQAKGEADQRAGGKPAKEVSLRGPESLSKAQQGSTTALPLVLSREAASERATEFMNVSDHSSLISRPQAVWELNQAWDRIVFLGPHADLPFISDTVNRLSPKQNLIKIPVMSELQPTFFLSLSLPSFPRALRCLFWAPLRESRLSIGLRASAILAGRPQRGDAPQRTQKCSGCGATAWDTGLTAKQGPGAVAV